MAPAVAEVAAAETEAPFLWLRFADVMLAAVTLPVAPLLPPPSGLRDGRDLELKEAAAASAKVANAGVDGLLARPLFVLTVPINGVGGRIGVACSRFASLSSGIFAVTLSFLLVPTFNVGGSADAAGAISPSGLAVSDLTGATLALSFEAFVSVAGLDPLLCAFWSGVAATTPLGLFEVTEGGR